MDNMKTGFEGGEGITRPVDRQNSLPEFVLVYQILILKMPRKPPPENVICLCLLLNILANFSNLFFNTGKQYGP